MHIYLKIVHFGTQIKRMKRIPADYFFISENPFHPCHPRSI